MKTIAIIQARMGSTRLPGKVLLKVGDTTLLEYQLMRVRQAKTIDRIVIATTINPEDDAIVAACKMMNVPCVRGSVLDVLDRYHAVLEAYPDYDVVIRLTGDCPLVDPALIDRTVQFFFTQPFDYVNNIGPIGHELSYPDGMCVEVITRVAFMTMWGSAQLPPEREHVTLYVRNHPELFRLGYLPGDANFGHIRLTVDRPEDFEVVRFLIEQSPPTAGYLDYIALLTKYPDVLVKNMHVPRNEGLQKSLSQDIKK